MFPRHPPTSPGSRRRGSTAQVEDLTYSFFPIYCFLSVVSSCYSCSVHNIVGCIIHDTFTESFLPLLIFVNKKSLRQTIRDQRCQLNMDEQRLAADQLAANAIASRLLHKFNRVACYLATDGEIDTWPLIKTLWSLKKQVYLPVVSHLPWTPLWFAPFNPDSDLILNRFGIPEPDVHPGKRVTARQLDLILMPLVAFDVSGHRLGMGQGFYDRSLKFMNHRKFWRRPLLAGIGHDFQCVKKVDSGPWDIPLQCAITDQRFINFV